MKIGCHVSIAGSVDLAFERAKNLGCNTFQIFTKNPRGWKARELVSEEKNSFNKKILKGDFSPIFSHISYLPNLASLDPEIYKKSLDSFILEIQRSISLSIPYFIIHSGSYKGGTIEEGFNKYLSSILKGIEEGKGKIAILIENSAGGKNSITGDLENIAKILNEVNDKKSVGVCFDTCHAFGAGYDLRNEKALKSTLEKIESTIGIENIAVVHANDSKAELKSNRDFHEHIGIGEIGELGFKAMINNSNLQIIPWILETPVNDFRGDKENIHYLLSLMEK
ncbi:MAG: deoxyribonuclease IV [Candidatus Heimdallarchaeota archaeon]|nr:deoxyribonuclease IV [Candidatus Heimdallarchaeota archaeon]MCK4954522.1 deoxyribonuclease IV [Candidatus Heimdallarchaeota archaeon]